MQRINALSLTSDVNDWLANSHQPRILHVFDHACNLINENKDVLSIVTQEIGNGPFNLVIEEDILFSDYLNIQSLVSSSAHQLHIGKLTIHAADAKLWSQRPDWEKLHRYKNNILHQLKIANYKNCGLDTPFATTAQGYSTTASLQFSNSLISTIASADIPSSLTAAKLLAGLGIGLTPSGDDFIMGALYASWIVHPQEIANVLAKEITETVAPLTTSLSSAWLRSAGKGEAGILWHNFFDALISVGRIGNPTYAMEKILATGETSGADALAGFFGVTSTFKDIIEKCPS